MTKEELKEVLGRYIVSNVSSSKNIYMEVAEAYAEKLEELGTIFDDRPETQQWFKRKAEALRFVFRGY